MKMRLVIEVEIDPRDNVKPYSDGLTLAVVDQINTHSGLRKDTIFLDDYYVIESEFIN